MCKCTPEIKTPFCGKLNCDWPKPEGTRDQSPAPQPPPPAELGLCELERVVKAASDAAGPSAAWSMISPATALKLIALVKRQGEELDAKYPTAFAYETVCKVLAEHKEALVAALADRSAFAEETQKYRDAWLKDQQEIAKVKEEMRVWSVSDTQARAYANELERKIAQAVAIADKALKPFADEWADMKRRNPNADWEHINIGQAMANKIAAHEARDQLAALSREDGGSDG